MPGIFTHRGSDLQISNLTINLETGEVGPIVVSQRIDTWNHWLLIARQMVDLSTSAKAQVLSANDNDDEQTLGVALEEEFRYSMLAISATAFVFDAFYDSARKRYQSHPDEGEWKKNRLARYKQISETFRWIWKIREKPADDLRDTLRQLFELRDAAVHPSAKFRVSVHRNDIDRGVEWRFAFYRADNARAAYDATRFYITEFITAAHAQAPAELQEWLGTCREASQTATGEQIVVPE